MAVSPGGLDPDQLRALRMLAESHFGCTQSVLLARGLKHEILTEIVDKGLAKATPGTGELRCGVHSPDDRDLSRRAHLDGCLRVAPRDAPIREKDCIRRLFGARPESVLQDREGAGVR